MKHLSIARKSVGNFLIAASMFATAAVAAQPACAAEKLRIGINLTTIETLPIYLAADGNSAVELSGGAIPSVTEGKADAATNAETQAILRSTENPDVRVILTVAEYAYHIVARRSSGIAKASDLRGKKIATSLNSSAHFYIVKTLREAGLAEADVTVVGMAPPDMPQALARGDVDAISIWEPAAQKSIDTLGADAVVINGPLYSERFNLNTSTAVIADPAQARGAGRFPARHRQLRRAMSADHPDRVQPVIAAKLNLPQDFVAKTWKLFQFPGRHRRRS